MSALLFSVLIKEEMFINKETPVKFIILFALVLSSSFALATPGDIGCAGKLKGKPVDLLLGYDYHGQKVPSLITVSFDSQVVFESTEVTRASLSSKNVFIANDEESKVKVTLGKNETAVLTVITDSGLFKAKNLKMNCAL